MGFKETVKQLLGLEAEAAATREAAADDLFEMSTAYITMEASLGFQPTGDGALCFADVDSSGFRRQVAEVEAMMDASAAETGTVSELREDDYGYQWVVIEAQDFEDLVTTIHIAAQTLIDGQYGSRLLAALFAFEGTEHAGIDPGQHVYWVYSFRRGAFYPFAPTGTDDRDRQAEFKLHSVLDGELSVEADREYWYPLWPDDPAGHPWE